MRRNSGDGGTTSNVDRIFFALADPTRRSLLDRLHARDGQRLRDLSVDFAMSRQAVSKHLDVLADAGLVVVRRGERGVPVHYLNRSIIHHVHDRWIEKYLRVS